MCCFSCFGISKEQQREEDRLASEEARARAADAAQRRRPFFPLHLFCFLSFFVEL
ncbi:hypothetical protein Taro_038193 [Colocasia esculenta]|uniref:Uncharacterized protein n=1 Tax=Colocasia esculenta TaxID=4460 RepID=A0A843WIG1_COLES|nr:hypothetical protein [Colocasia esculenta]